MCETLCVVHLLRWNGTIARPPQNAHNDGTVLPVANLMAHSESGTSISYTSFTVTTGLSCLISEIFACDTQADGGVTTVLFPVLTGSLKQRIFVNVMRY